jgi:APA family basic amino acid/polyamine antiporter
VTFRRALGPFDATMVVIGGIIGSGIFINPYLVAQTVASPGAVLSAWALGGIVALVGALAYGELGQRMPKAGGQYAYLREAWHPVAGFLYGWALLLMIETGAMAAVAIAFAEYTLRLAGHAGANPRGLAVATLAVLSIVNYVGVRPGSRLLNVFVLLKVAALAVLIGIAFWGPPAPQWLTASRQPMSVTTVTAFGAALIPILFTYGGWQCANYLAEEMKAPERDLPRSLLAGTLVVVAVYLLVNVAYLRSLGHAGLAATTTPAATAAAQWLGPAAEKFVACAIAISTFGFLDLSILAPTRVYYAMAADGAFIPALAQIHPRFQTPGAAIILQSAWAILLTLTGKYNDLLGTVVFGDWIFFGLTVASLFVLRRRQGPTTGFEMPGYPWLPAAFVIVAMAVVASAVHEAPWRSAAGFGLLVAGVPVYYYFTARGTRSRA